ncbi:MAG: hypothetical protein B6244_01370 [Candidatus Cloacimonetes bacterium 4572_55]|nr:MAG: hypothetical protein B6244_01370 [Candidatus Cloacimonetes bacterium 4572_55]
MAIKGSLNEASLPDIIQLLSIGRKNGVLSITNRQNFGNIYLKDGDVIYANIVNREDRLGNILVKRDRVSKKDLELAIQEQQKKHNQKMLGKILVERGLITEKELIEYLQIQIEEAIYTLLTWRDGFFVFEPNRVLKEDVPTLKIRTSKLIMEAARRIDEWEVMRVKIRSLKMMVRIVGKDGINIASLDELGCSEEEWRILSFVNNTRSIQELADLTSINEFDVARVIYGLISSGIVEVYEPKPASSLLLAHDHRIDELHNLGLAFLKAELYEEARKEYDKILQLNLDDEKATFYQGLIAFKQNDLDQSIKHFEKLISFYKDPRASAYNDLALCYEKVGQLEKAIIVLEKGLKKNPHHLKMQINLGRITAKNGNLERALIILDNASNRDPEFPLPNFYLGLVLIQSGEYQAALELYDLLKDDQKNEAIWNNEGVAFEVIGKNKEAIDSYRNALKSSSKLIESRRNLADLFYRHSWHQDALNEYIQLVEINPSSSEAYFKIGNIHMKYQEREKALLAWEQSLELDGTNELLRRNIETVKKLKLVSLDG